MANPGTPSGKHPPGMSPDELREAWETGSRSLLEGFRQAQEVWNNAARSWGEVAGAWAAAPPAPGAGAGPGRRWGRPARAARGGARRRRGVDAPAPHARQRRLAERAVRRHCAPPPGTGQGVQALDGRAHARRRDPSPGWRRADLIAHAMAPRQVR